MMLLSETKAREAIVKRGNALMRAGLTPGSSGNISVRLDDSVLVTPTNSRLGELDPAEIAKVDFKGKHLSGGKPSKEAFLHLKMFAKRPGDAAVVHLHSTHAAAVSCIEGLCAENALPALTAYYVMRVGVLPIAPYFPPGGMELADAVEALATKHHAILLSNHGPVASGVSLEAASCAIEEVEESSKIFLLLQNLPVKRLSEVQIAHLQTKFAS